ncbi:MAG: amidohydrolase family protein [Victivallales bacterium]|nr:amidohydrolase family protein [Victivallales bacterium]
MLTNDNDRRIYEEELSPRLPQKLFDAHVHIWSKADYPADFRFPDKNCANRFGGEFTLSMWRDIMAELLPQQECHLNCFGMPNNAADRSKTPDGALPGDSINVLISPADAAELVEERIDRAGAVGVKPYWNYAAAFYGKTSNEVEINDMLTPQQLAMLDRKGLAVTLHIPRSGRFADKVNQRQMLELCEKYPNVRFVFAHIGRAYFMKNIYQSNIDDFVKYPNAYFDTAMLNHEGVLKYTFDHFPAERIVFGSDAPIAFLRGKSVEINDQYAYLMGEDYAVGTSIVDTKNAVNFTTFFYEQLRAILNTTPKGHVSDVLFNNAQRVFRKLGA